MDASKRMNLSSVRLPTHQSCCVSTIHIPTFRQQRNVSSRYTVSAFPLFLFKDESSLQLEKVLPLDKHSNNRNNPLLPALFYNGHKTHLNWNNQSFFWVLVVLKLSILQSGLNIWKHDMTIFLKLLYLFWPGWKLFKSASNSYLFVEFCRHRLTHVVKVKLASIFSNDRIAEYMDLRIWVSSTTAWRINTIDNPSTISSWHFESRSLSLSVDE